MLGIITTIIWGSCITWWAMWWICEETACSNIYKKAQILKLPSIRLQKLHFSLCILTLEICHLGPNSNSVLTSIFFLPYLNRKHPEKHYTNITIASFSITRTNLIGVFFSKICDYPYDNTHQQLLKLEFSYFPGPSGIDALWGVIPRDEVEPLVISEVSEDRF